MIRPCRKKTGHVTRCGDYVGTSSTHIGLCDECWAKALVENHIKTRRIEKERV